MVRIFVRSMTDKATTYNATIRKAVAVALISTSVTVALLSESSQATTAGTRQVMVDEHIACHQLAKLQSQRSTAKQDLERNLEILYRLRRLYEAGAVAEASYTAQRQAVFRLMSEQRKRYQFVQQLRSQLSSSECAFTTAIAQLGRSHHNRNQPAPEPVQTPLPVGQ